MPEMVDTTPKGSQFNQHSLSSQAHVQDCAETSYARLITQLFGEQMYISNATGCSSIWGNPAATSPYTVISTLRRDQLGLTHSSRIMLSMV